MHLNPGNRAFYEAVNSKIYVDKTGLISYTNSVLNTLQKFVSVSRPRRFGKSMAADMLVAYYSSGCDSAELFAGRAAEKGELFQEHLNQHNVIRLDMQRFLESERELDTFIGKIENGVVAELKKMFPECNDFSLNSRLKMVLEQIFSQTGKGFIFIIDEWDCVFRVAKEHKEAQKEYLDFLRGLFKGAEYVDMAYMTGILPIKKYGEHKVNSAEGRREGPLGGSALNIFDEYSMIDSGELTPYFGFDEDEVRELCGQNNVSFSEVQKWYDGYFLNGCHIYNPKSVVDVMRRGKFRSYWTGTETYEALKVYIDMNFNGLKEAIIEMLSNVRCKINTRKFQNDMTTFKTRDDVLTLLVHLGYLAYDEGTGEAFIPNQEIAEEFLNVVDDDGWDGLAQALSRSEGLLKSTWALDGEAVAEGVAAIHGETASILKYNDENSLACTVLMAYYGAKAYYMNPIMELPTGKGFADVAYLPKRQVDRPALVVELKWNKSAEGAIKQIKDRRYADWIEGYTGKILLVGINYNEKKEHECVIEEYLKE